MNVEEKIEASVFPPMSIIWIAIFAMAVAVFMIVQSIWLTDLHPAYEFQVLGGWVCFFLVFYLHNRFDKLNKIALTQLREVMDGQLLELKELMSSKEVTAALMISEAERMRLAAKGELN